MHILGALHPVKSRHWIPAAAVPDWGTLPFIFIPVINCNRRSVAKKFNNCSMNGKTPEQPEGAQLPHSALCLGVFMPLNCCRLLCRAGSGRAEISIGIVPTPGLQGKHKRKHLMPHSYSSTHSLAP